MAIKSFADTVGKNRIPICIPIFPKKTKSHEFLSNLWALPQNFSGALKIAYIFTSLCDGGNFSVRSEFWGVYHLGITKNFTHSYFCYKKHVSM